MSDEAKALATIQQIGKAAGDAINARRERMMLVLGRSEIPRGHRVKLVDGQKSPFGEIASVNNRNGAISVNAWFEPYDVLAFCIAAAEQLGGSIPVRVVGPDGAVEYEG